MKIRDIVRSAIRNTFRSKVRTTLTVLSLFVGAFTLTLTTALGTGVSDYVDAQVGSLGGGNTLLVTKTSDQAATDDGPKEYDPLTSGAASPAVNPLGATDPISESDLDEVAVIDGVTEVDPVRQVPIDYVAFDGGTKYELAINATSSITRADLIAGEQLDQGSSERQLILPSDYVDALGYDDADDAVGSTLDIGFTDALGGKRMTDVTVVGVSQTSLLAAGAGANESALADIADGREEGVVNDNPSYVVAIAYIDTDESTVAEIKSDLTDAGFSGQTVEDQLGVIQTVISGIIGILNAFAAIALISAAFGIVNTLLMSVQERTREIGLMKAMGMSGAKVFALFSLEAVVIGFLGSAIGAVAAIGLGSAISAVAASGPLADLPGLTILTFDPISVAGVIVLIMAIAFLAGTLPARRAARQNPIDSLRYE